MKEMKTLNGYEIVDEKARQMVSDAIPTTTIADAGKFLRVSADGKWNAETVTNAEEVAY